jgi:hypothetical protein
LNANDVGVPLVSIHGKAMAHVVDSKVAWNTTETKHWEAFVVVVRFHDGANIQKG